MCMLATTYRPTGQQCPGGIGWRCSGDRLTSSVGRLVLVGARVELGVLDAGGVQWYTISSRTRGPTPVEPRRHLSLAPTSCRVLVCESVTLCDAAFKCSMHSLRSGDFPQRCVATRSSSRRPGVEPPLVAAAHLRGPKNFRAHFSSLSTLNSAKQQAPIMAFRIRADNTAALPAAIMSWSSIIHLT